MTYTRQALEFLARQKLRSLLTEKGKSLIWSIIKLERHEPSKKNIFTFKSQEYQSFSLQITIKE